RLLSDLAPALHDDQPRHLHPRHAGGGGRAERLRGGREALSGGHAGRGCRGGRGGHPAARRTVSLPPGPPERLRAVRRPTGGAGRPGSPCGRQAAALAPTTAAVWRRGWARLPLTSRIISIWPGVPAASEPMPTAERACRPFSPKTSTIRSEKPLITFGCSVKLSTALTMPSTLTTRS